MQACSQTPDIKAIDKAVESAIYQSEQSLFEADFDKALVLIAPTKFEKSEQFSDIHRVQLLIQELRIKGFQSILLRLENNATDRLYRLKKFYIPATTTENPDIRADYFLTLSSTYRSVGKKDSALLFANKARGLYTDEKKLDELAKLDANEISRKHNQFLAEGKREEILSLIPTYRQLVESSRQHSTYALAYNTRHLAQVYRRQTREFGKALELFQASLAARQEIGFKPFIPASYSSIADVYLAMGNYEMAIKIYSEAQALATEIGFIRYEYYPLLKIGDIYLAKENTERAAEYFHKAQSIATVHDYTAAIKEVEARLDNLKEGN